MSKIAIKVLILAMLSVSVLSCKKDINKEKPPDFPDDLELVDAKIILPQGSNYSLSEHEIFHSSQSFPVSFDGNTKVVKPSGRKSIAYVLNKDGKVAMAGFITDSTSSISTETTAKVLLYFAMGVHMLPDTLNHKFINNIDKVTGINDWLTEFTTIWKSDPLTFNTGSYRAKLRTWLEAKDKELPSAGSGKVGSVQVNSNDVRSGLRLSPEGLALSFTNNYRRRVTGFFYKMKHKLTGSNEYTPIISTINNDSKYDTSAFIDPASGITSVTGEIWKNWRGNGLESFAMNTGPFYFDLKDNEKEAVYRVRVIGPGEVDLSKLTTREEVEYFGLISYNMAVDVFVPVWSCVFGVLDHSAVEGGGIEKFIMVDVPKLVPGFFEYCARGQYQKAIMGLVDGLISDHGLELVAEKLLVDLYPEGKIPANVTGVMKKGALILQGLDMAMLGGDFVRLWTEWNISKGLEEWDFTLRAGKVKVSPEESVVSAFAPSNEQKIEATVQNLASDEASRVEYEWTAKGNFGTIEDSKGNFGVQFRTKDNKVKFLSKNDPSLTDGDNLERVIVKAFLDNNEIGVDTAVINVKKARYQLKPDGVTISGKEGQTNSVQLRIEPVATNGVGIPNTDLDYKIIWETTGAYGSLRFLASNSKIVTTYNYAKVEYECTNSEVKSASETVTARIYSKKKGQPESEYRLMENIKANVKIMNDEKKIVKHIPITCQHADSTWDNGQSMKCVIEAYSMVTAEPNAKNYSIRFYDVLFPFSRTWEAGSASVQNMLVYNFVVPRSANQWAIEYDISWSLGPAASVVHLKCSPPKGMAEVIITLK